MTTITLKDWVLNKELNITYASNMLELLFYDSFSQHISAPVLINFNDIFSFISENYNTNNISHKRIKFSTSDELFLQTWNSANRYRYIFFEIFITNRMCMYCSSVCLKNDECDRLVEFLKNCSSNNFVIQKRLF